MNNNPTVATIAIWIATTIISVFALMSDGWVVSIPLGVALIATLAIWIASSTAKTSNSTNEKSKSDNTPYTMALLMEMMDEDEREEFKYDLKRRVLSGETLTNESLVEELDKRKRG